MLESIGLKFKPLPLPTPPTRQTAKTVSFAATPTKKKKNCVRGLSCGASCIAGSKICNKSLSQKQQAKVADLKKRAKGGDTKAQEQLGKIAQEQMDKQNRQAKREVERMIGIKPEKANSNKSKGEDLTLEDLDKGDQELKQSLNRIGRASGDSVADTEKKWVEINRKSQSDKKDLSLTELQLEDELASKRSGKSDKSTEDVVNGSITIPLIKPGGKVENKTIEAKNVGGLSVHKSLSNLGKKWQVSHTSSGLSLEMQYDTQKEAIEAAKSAQAKVPRLRQTFKTIALTDQERGELKNIKDGAVKRGELKNIKDGAVKRAERNYDRSLDTGDPQAILDAGKQAMKARRQKYDDGTPRSIAPKEPSNDLNDKAFDRAQKRTKERAAMGDDIGALDAAKEGIQALKRKYADTDTPAPTSQKDDLAARRDKKLQLTNEVGLNLKAPETPAQKDIADAALDAIRQGTSKSRSELGAILEKYGIGDDTQIQSDIYQSTELKAQLEKAYKKLNKGDAGKLAALHAQKLADSSEVSARKLSVALVNAGIDQDVFADKGGIVESIDFEQIVRKVIRKNVK